MRHFRTMLATAPVAFAVLAGPATASTAGASVAEPPRTSALELAVAWNVVTLDDLAASTTGTRATVRLPLDRGPIELDLERHSVRSLDFTVYVQDEMGIRIAPAPEVRTYRGAVAGKPESQAYGSIIDGRFTGKFRLLPEDPWTIVEPLDEHDPAAGRFEHVVIDTPDILPHGGLCGVDDAFLASQGIVPDGDVIMEPAINGAARKTHVCGEDCSHGTDRAAAGTSAKGAPVVPMTTGASSDEFIGMSEGGLIEVTDILIDADFQFFLQNGGSVSSTVADIENVMNGVSFVYERDTELTWEITGILVRSSSAANPYTTADPGGLLCQVVQEWNSGALPTIRRDTTHLFTGRQLIGSTIGIAFNGVICNVSASSPCGGGAQNLAYGLSQSRFNTFYDARVSLTAHELGHNYNSPHCTGGNCHIMCASVNGCGGTYGSDLKFGLASQNVIENYANTRPCLEFQPPTLGLPFEDDFPGSSFNPSKWSWFVEAVTTSSPPFTPPSGARVAELRSFQDIPFRQGDLRSAEIDLSGLSGVQLEFAAARSGLEPGEGLIVEYRSATNQWNQVFFLPSDGTDQDFIPFSLPLPFAAYHDEFRIRFRLDGNDFTDRVYLDDIRIGLPEEEPCVGDADGDGEVGFDDLLAVLSAFGPCPAPCAPDFDGNGVVEFDDLLTVLSSFGPCP